MSRMLWQTLAWAVLTGAIIASPDWGWGQEFDRLPPCCTLPSSGAEFIAQLAGRPEDDDPGALWKFIQSQFKGAQGTSLTSARQALVGACADECNETFRRAALMLDFMIERWPEEYPEGATPLAAFGLTPSAEEIASGRTSSWPPRRLPDEGLRLPRRPTTSIGVPALGKSRASSKAAVPRAAVLPPAPASEIGLAALREVEQWRGTPYALSLHVSKLFRGSEIEGLEAARATLAGRCHPDCSDRLVVARVAIDALIDSKFREAAAAQQRKAEARELGLKYGDWFVGLAAAVVTALITALLVDRKANRRQERLMIQLMRDRRPLTKRLRLRTGS